MLWTSVCLEVLPVELKQNVLTQTLTETYMPFQTEYSVGFVFTNTHLTFVKSCRCLKIEPGAIILNTPTLYLQWTSSNF